MSKSYKTEGKERLISFLSSRPDTQFTVEQICVSLHGDMSCRSSIYRNLSALCRDGIVRKFRSEGQTSFVYQYLGGESRCHDHFHLKCIVCGRLTHLECKMGDELRSHIMSDHGFIVDSGRSILYGKCRNCSNGV